MKRKAADICDRRDIVADKYKNKYDYCNCSVWNVFALYPYKIKWSACSFKCLDKNKYFDYQHSKDSSVA